MGLSDPFGTTYEGARKGAGTFGDMLVAIAEADRQKRLKEQEMQMASQFKEQERQREFPRELKLEREKARYKQQFQNPLDVLKDTLETEKIRRELAGELTDKETLNRATQLRKEFNTDQTFKNFQVLQRSEDQMKEAYKLATSPDAQSRIASDQALAVTFQKMIDPQSVVRESEYARTPEGVALMNKMGSFVEQLQKGGLRIKDEDRLALIQASEKMLKSGKKQMNQHIKRYKSLAKDYQVKPQLILGDIEEFPIEKTFLVNGERYDIPSDEAEDFLKDNPDAQEI